MKRVENWVFRIGMVSAFLAGGTVVGWAHVNFRLVGAVPVAGRDNHVLAILTVPNERTVNDVAVSLEVPDAFLKAGGRLAKVVFPSGWEVKLDKESIPDDIYQTDAADRARRREEFRRTRGDSGATAADQEEEENMNEFRREWIKKVTFTALPGNAIPPDGLGTFHIIFQVPKESGRFRFAAVQTYEDGKQVAWDELVPRAEHPAATLPVGSPSRIPYYAAGGGASLLAILLGWQGARRRRQRSAIPAGAIPEQVHR